MQNLEEQDMMAEALAKQDKLNQDSGLSMAELMKQKREKTEKLIEENKDDGGPSQNEKEERKARLIAQRDLLRKAKEIKRKEEMEEFKQKTETKADLFNELKKMDDEMKTKMNNMKTDAEQQRRLEMFRKARTDVK